MPDSRKSMVYSSARTCLVALLAFLALDACWLTWAGPRLYRPAIGHLMRTDFDVPAAALFYLLYTAAMAVFAIQPSRHFREAALRGALFGLAAYATYDLTNQATLREWPWHVTLVDLAWGAFATAASSGIAHAVTQRTTRTVR